MSDETATLQSVPGTDTIYIVQAGDSLRSIARKFYGDESKYALIAEFNRIQPTSVLYIGSRLVIPAHMQTGVEEVQTTVRRLPESPGGSTAVDYGGTVIETVTTTAPRIKAWWEDWRVWLALFGVAGLVWFLTRGKRS